MAIFPIVCFCCCFILSVWTVLLTTVVSFCLRDVTSRAKSSLLYHWGKGTSLFPRHCFPGEGRNHVPRWRWFLTWRRFLGRRSWTGERGSSPGPCPLLARPPGRTCFQPGSLAPEIHLFFFHSSSFHLFTSVSTYNLDHWHQNFFFIYLFRQQGINGLFVRHSCSHIFSTKIKPFSFWFAMTNRITPPTTHAHTMDAACRHKEIGVKALKLSLSQFCRK